VSLKRDLDIRRWTQPAGFFRPLDDAHCSPVKVFFQTRIVPLLRAVESIKIKVIDTIPRSYVKFNQCVGRAFYRTAVSQRVQQPTREGGLACTEFPDQMQHQPGTQNGCERSTQ